MPLPERADDWTGPQLFDAYCAACHQASGEGTGDGAMPALYNNTATGRPESNNLALVILQGIHWVGEGHDVHMPGFAAELSDRQIVTLGNYLTQMYGNPKVRLNNEQVAALRQDVSAGQPDLLLLARVGMLVVVFIGLLLFWLVWRRCTARARTGRQAL